MACRGTRPRAKGRPRAQGGGASVTARRERGGAGAGVNVGFDAQGRRGRRGRRTPSRPQRQPASAAHISSQSVASRRGGPPEGLALRQCLDGRGRLETSSSWGRGRGAAGGRGGAGGAGARQGRLGRVAPCAGTGTGGSGGTPNWAGAAEGRGKAGAGSAAAQAKALAGAGNRRQPQARRRQTRTSGATIRAVAAKRTTNMDGHAHRIRVLAHATARVQARRTPREAGPTVCQASRRRTWQHGRRGCSCLCAGASLGRAWPCEAAGSRASKLVCCRRRQLFTAGAGAACRCHGAATGQGFEAGAPGLWHQTGRALRQPPRPADRLLGRGAREPSYRSCQRRTPSTVAAPSPALDAWP